VAAQFGTCDKLKIVAGSHRWTRLQVSAFSSPKTKKKLVCFLRRFVEGYLEHVVDLVGGTKLPPLGNY